MTAIATPDLLTASLDSCRREIVFDEPKARKVLEETLAQPLLPCETAQVLEGERRYAAYWLTSRVAQEYPIISEELFKLTRNLQHRVSTREIENAPVPTIWAVPLDKPIQKTEVKEIKGSVSVPGGYTETRFFTARAEVPEFTAEARAAYLESLATAAEISRDAYREPLVAKILLATNISLPHQATYKMIWAPEHVSVTAIAPSPKDPAIIMCYGRMNFLVHKWNTPNERPIDSFLRDFSAAFSDNQTQELL